MFYIFFHSIREKGIYFFLKWLVLTLYHSPVEVQANYSLRCLWLRGNHPAWSSVTMSMWVRLHRSPQEAPRPLECSLGSTCTCGKEHSHLGLQGFGLPEGLPITQGSLESGVQHAALFIPPTVFPKHCSVLGVGSSKPWSPNYLFYPSRGQYCCAFIVLISFLPG